MRKLTILLVIVSVLGLGYFVYTNFVKTGALQSVVDSVTPTNKAIKNFLPLGEDLSYQLKISSGLRMGVFADLGSGRPRVLAIDPGGVLVTSLPGNGSVVALPDKDLNGTADENISILTNLNQPHGILFNGKYLYVAETNKVVRYVYDKNTFKATGREELFGLPSGGGHSTRTIKVHDNKLYTSVGSSCNVCLENDPHRSTILISDLDGKNLKIYAKGLRNTVFFVFDKDGRMWGNDMGRDNLGDKLPPDELNIIEESDYGWPYCYGAKIRDKNFMGDTEPNYCVNTKAPAFEYGAHIAPLGLAIIDSELFAPDEQGDILSAQHGSWNSSVPVGYKIVKLDVSGGRVVGSSDFVTGFIEGREVLGRPVDLLFDETGYLYITDDKSGLVYVVSKN